MSDLVQLTKDQDVAIITINNPPVNALGPGVPEGISQAVKEVTQDERVKAAVLIGAGRTFVAGADIKEFGKMTSGKTARGAGFLPLLRQIEDCPKPVVMAIHGTAFGGGLELAMSGHYRVGGSGRPSRSARREARHHSGRRRDATVASVGGRG
jgi:3-hydroxyacyl-CoA dehydrogenase